MRQRGLIVRRAPQQLEAVDPVVDLSLGTPQGLDLVPDTLLLGRHGLRIHAPGLQFERFPLGILRRRPDFDRKMRVRKFLEAKADLNPLPVIAARGRPAWLVGQEGVLDALVVHGYLPKPLATTN